MPSSPKTATNRALQRRCACRHHAPSGNECKECAKTATALKRKPWVESELAGVPGIVHDVLRSPGRSLDQATRAFMEPRFGHDFSGVRVHTDAMAVESARAVNAKAYTVGRDVVLDTTSGGFESYGQKLLLAHELTHVLQQGAAPIPRQPQQAGYAGPEIRAMPWKHAWVGGAGQSTGARLQAKMQNGQEEEGQHEEQADHIANEIMQGTAKGEVVSAEPEAGVVASEQESSQNVELIFGGGGPIPPPKAVAGRKAEKRRAKGRAGQRSYISEVHLKLPSLGSPDRSHTTAGVSALAGDASGNTAGLTRLRYTLHSSVRTASKGNRHWITKITVWLSDVVLKVFLTKDNRPGSCSDKALMRHEMHHVADYRRNVESEEQVLRHNLAPGAWPDVTSPLSLATISAADLVREITTLIDLRNWEIKYNNWLDGTAWDTVDYPKMYSGCPGVRPVVGVPAIDSGYPGKPPEVFAPPLPNKGL